VKVFLTGGTGAVGRPALACLVAAGHEVTALARTPAKAAEVTAAGAAAAPAVDLFEPAAVTAAVHGHEAVVNLATHVPPPTRAARGSAWATHDRLRREASAHLVDAALAAGATRFVQESIVFSYPDSGDRWLDAETTATVPGAVTDAAVAAEAQVARFTAAGGTGVVLRFGLFYGRGTTYTDAMLRWARRGVVYSPGTADGYASSIHVQDAAAAAAVALAAPAGIYDVTDDEPLTHDEQARVLAAAAGRSRFVRAPGRLARFAGPAGEVGMRSQRVSNRRFREATGWAPRWPSLAEGLAEPPA
jgi:nucleoside-diphosphate-sugar epimerase